MTQTHSIASHSQVRTDMNINFHDFVTAHGLPPAEDELSTAAVVGLEYLIAHHRACDSDSDEATRSICTAAHLLARHLPLPPLPQPGCGSSSPWFMPSQFVAARSLRRLEAKLAEHDAGDYIDPVEVACDVADLIQACDEAVAAAAPR